MAHKWVHWRYLLLNGRIRKKGIAQPRRERLLVREALSQLGFRYKELVPVSNPYYSGHKGVTEGAIQWLDFTVWDGRRMIVLLFAPNWSGSGATKRQKLAFEAKKRLLTERNIPHLVLSRSETAQIYKTLIGNLSKRRLNEQRANPTSSPTTDDR